MSRQSTVASLLLVVFVGLSSNVVQGFSFEDLISDKIDKKLEKYCKFPGLEFLCEEDDPSVSVSADEGHRNLRA